MTWTNICSQEFYRRFSEKIHDEGLAKQLRQSRLGEYASQEA